MRLDNETIIRLFFCLLKHSKNIKGAPPKTKGWKMLSEIQGTHLVLQSHSQPFSLPSQAHLSSVPSVVVGLVYALQQPGSLASVFRWVLLMGDASSSVQGQKRVTVFLYQKIQLLQQDLTQLQLSLSSHNFFLSLQPELLALIFLTQG